MATIPFRPPQFSDDAAWLPAWLQPNHSAPTSSQPELFRSSLQDVGSFKGENGQVKELNLSTNQECRYNICRLYLSGEESTSVTVTPSCEKVLHFHLHLSTDGTPSTIPNPLLHALEVDKLNSTQALDDIREESQCNIGHDSSALNIVRSPSSATHSGHFSEQTPSSNDAGQNTSEILKSNFFEGDEVSDAVELSVVASEALVIHKIVQSGSFSEALSTSAILDIALRVKHARLDEFKGSSYCFADSDYVADILSDLVDSDMEDAYMDVGLSINSLDNVTLKDTPTSRVKETPLSDISGGDKEVQCQWQGDQEIFTTEPEENNQDTNKSKDLPAGISDYVKLEKLCRDTPLDLICKEKNDIAYADGIPHRLEIKSLPQSQHSSRLDPISTVWHSHHIDINEIHERSSCRFQSRWYGGWTGTEVDARGQLKLKGKKTVPKFFIGETSYLSESMEGFPDQNSVVHHQHLSSNSTESGKPFNDFCKRASEGEFVSQEFVKDSASYVDPLCSMVPCSISAQNCDSFLYINNKDDQQVIDALKSLPTGMEVSQTSCSHNNENVGREKQAELDFDDVGPDLCPLIRRQLTSLKTYSTVLPGNSTFSYKRNWFVRLKENDDWELSDSTKSLNDKDETKQPSVVAARNNQEGQEMKLLPVEQYISCPNTSEKRFSEKQPPIKSIFSCTTGTKNKKNYVENACGRMIQDQLERNGVELKVDVEDIPTSPLILCRGIRKLKAPNLHVSDVTTANLLEDQSPTSDNICQEIRQMPQDQFRNLPRGDVPARKRVRFSVVDFDLRLPQGQLKKNPKRIHTCENRSSCRLEDRPENCDHEQVTASQEVKERLTKCQGRKRTIFQGLDFLLTGFSKKKEKEIEGTLRKYGGMVLFDIPAPPPHPRGRRSMRLNAERLPVVLCTKKLQTTRFLYGCAVNAFLLKVGWVYESIRVGSVLPPDKYLVLSYQNNRMLNQIGKSICQNDNGYIFDRVGIMLHGTHSFCTKLANVIKCGRGQVYKSLQWLAQSLKKKKISLGAIVAEDDHRATRHLKKCASEQKIAVVPASWITNSLFEGKLLPLTEYNHLSNPRTISVPDISVLQEWSQEI